MNATIWLIAEDESDYRLLRHLIRRKGFDIRVKRQGLLGGSGGISRLAHQLPRLIAHLQAKKQPGDCIAVFHDADTNTQADRSTYTRIRQECDRHADVSLIVAHDEIESWLLADAGLCKWLHQNPRNRDNEAKPSDTLKSLLMRQHKLKYQGPSREKVWQHLDATGDQHSPSMQDALSKLEKAPCMKNNMCR